MAATGIVDTGFLVALLCRRDAHRAWAREQAARHSPPWLTCEAVLSESFHLLGGNGIAGLGELLDLGALSSAFVLAEHRGPVIALMKKYGRLPTDFADACLVRMTEVISDCVVPTTDSDFRIYRRHGRRTIPSILPS
jgi:predicted nucleic acid-binding protein